MLQQTNQHFRGGQFRGKQRLRVPGVAGVPFAECQNTNRTSPTSSSWHLIVHESNVTTAAVYSIPSNAINASIARSESLVMNVRALVDGNRFERKAETESHPSNGLNDIHSLNGCKR